MDANASQTPSPAAKRKVHITLVGREPEPVYNGIIHAKPQVLEFVYTNETKGHVDRIRAKVDAEVAESLPLAPTDPAEIAAWARMLCEKYAGDSLTVNVSGGTKPQSIIFAKEFWSHPNCQVLVIDQNQYVYDLKTGSKERLNLTQDLHGSIGLQGTDIASCTSLEDYNRHDDLALERVERLRRRCRWQFTRLFALDEDKVHAQIMSTGDGSHYFADGSWIEWLWHESGIRHVEISVGVKLFNASEIKCGIDSPHGADLLFKSGWYEYKVARALKKWSKAKTVLLNCVFRTKEDAAKNEVDIILGTVDKMVFVECKTQIKNINEIDKFQSVLRVYGGKASKGVFVTSEEKSAVAKEKCHDHGILDVVYGSDADLPAVFRLLDIEHDKINPA